MNGELAEAGTGRQALRQLQLEILETAAADGTAEAHDGRLADADFLGQVGHGTVHHLGRVLQDVIGDLQFGLAEQVTGLGDVLQKIHGQGSVVVSMTKAPTIGFDATTTISRTEFGVGAYAPNVGDAVTLRITTEASAPKGN